MDGSMSFVVLTLICRYDKFDPPKKVELIPAYLIRMINRPKKDFYCIGTFSFLVSLTYQNP